MDSCAGMSEQPREGEGTDEGRNSSPINATDLPQCLNRISNKTHGFIDSDI